MATRFLRARKYDAKAAMEMVVASRKWRDEAKLEDLADVPTSELLGCPIDELNAFYPHAYLPVLDAENRPVYIECTGRIDVPALMCSTSQEGLLAWHKKQLVTKTPMKMRAATEARGDGRVVNSSTTIMDLEGFTMGMLMGATKEYLGAISKMDSVRRARRREERPRTARCPKRPRAPGRQARCRPSHPARHHGSFPTFPFLPSPPPLQDNFPETLGATLIINAPTIFSVAWGIVKAFLDPRTQAKVTVLGTNYREKLFALLGGASHVPTMYGGTLEVPGMFDSTLRKHAVHSGKKYCVAVRCDAGQGCRIRWMSDPADVEFSVVAITGSASVLDTAQAHPDGAADGSAHTVVYAKKAHPDSKTNTVECLVDGADVKEDTVFVATWDNSAGWSQRNIRFFATAMPSHAEAAELYAAELVDHGIPKDHAVAALRKRGYDAKAAELEGKDADSGAAASASAAAE